MFLAQEVVIASVSICLESLLRRGDKPGNFEGWDSTYRSTYSREPRQSWKSRGPVNHCQCISRAKAVWQLE